MKHLAVPTALLLLASCTFDGLEPSLLTDPNFNSWCGDSLCNWETEEGKIRRVATWNSSDYGVELVSSPAVISQEAALDGIVPPIDLGWSRYGRALCLRISVLGNVQVEAEVDLELDFFSDGTVDYQNTLPGLDWDRIELLVKLPEVSFSSLRTSLHKRGTGTAVFAHLDLAGVAECSGAPIQLAPLKSGRACTENARCESGRCSFGDSEPRALSGVCVDCYETRDCDGGLVCGLAPETESVGAHLGCVAPRATPTGDGCFGDAQCVSGSCVSDICSDAGL